MFGNLRFVWIGIGTHYLLDLLGNVKGMAVLYPLPGLYDVPVGVDVDSRWADVVTLAVTAFELALLGALVVLGHETHLAGPELPVSVRTVLGLGRRRPRGQLRHSSGSDRASYTRPPVFRSRTYSSFWLQPRQ